ncbi:MAG: tetratricopeptide repeat protein [Desulfobacteraceae bacterium]|nr:tetratricopeptide repeat protein [Desulfobacteraceae bacterium]
MKKDLGNAYPIRRWEITGIIATLVIVLCIPIYVLKTKYITGTSFENPEVPAATFVGRKKCVDCHRKEYEKWQNSHHDKAMDVANDETVLGNFNNTVFEHKGVQSRFFRQGEKFFVHTQGPNGKMADFEIQYTFGYTPLQQYLIPFPGGRLQCLTIAWDVEKKRWYHLYPDEPNDPTDWLHWTKNANNWNGMCAECHSTHLQKRYDMKTNTYDTTWSEIDVSCEACHGPGARHVAWAEVPEMARSQDIDNYGLVVRTGNISARQQVELCARCHARRATLGDYDHFGKDIMDYLIPQLLGDGIYFPDGQILEEVYVYGSFTQSKMYQRGVRCSDCHDVHSLKFHKKGNDLCLQCHRADQYDTKDHHFHKKKGEPGDPVLAKDGSILYEVGEGGECFKCHMPGRNYMGIDYRNDHSIRIPRPDLSIATNTPNSCKECHWDKPDQWSADYCTEWYGIKRRPHYGTVLAAGRKGLPEAQTELIRLATDLLSPGIVRATALSLLRSYPNEHSLKAFERALMDPEPLVRHTAIHDLSQLNPGISTRLITPLLYDPVKAVRIQAGMAMTSLSRSQLNNRQIKVFDSALDEYQDAMAYVGDFTHGQFNLGNMHRNLGNLNLAEKHYKAAIQIDRLFYPAKINLAMLKHQVGMNDEAERLFREVMDEHPQLYEAAYSLGLLLVELKKYDEAVQYVSKAALGMPKRARVQYNLGLLLQQLGRTEEAEAALLRSLEMEPDSIDYLHAVADHYLRQGKLHEARRIAEQMVAKHPKNNLGRRLLRFIDQTMKKKKR